ncbi:MAG: PEP-CTERM sorting domain-containing protein [Kastovskya adunca ATA6-11-RM4]|jgi:hypothetical protein|nr:PEP-CTERM sorting domain-containing protein [Kastovskya adunca ATA6-11-RM4]
MLKNKSALYLGLSAIAMVSSVALPAPVLAAIATFDSFAEGASGTTITDGGITFFDLDVGSAPGEPFPEFVVESTDEFEPFFSRPNYLTAGGFAEGSAFSFGAINSLRFTNRKIESAASLDVFSLLPFEPTSNVLTLEALLNGALVASQQVALADFEVFGSFDDLLYQNLAISGVQFNELRLVSSGDDNGAFIGIDNVRVGELASVPEPTSILGVLAFAAFGSVSVLKRKHQ